MFEKNNYQDLNILSLPYDLLQKEQVYKGVDKLNISLKAELLEELADRKEMRWERLFLAAVICYIYRYTLDENFMCIYSSQGINTEINFNIANTIRFLDVYQLISEELELLGNKKEYQINFKNNSFIYREYVSSYQIPEGKDICFVYKNNSHSYTLDMLFDGEQFEKETMFRMRDNFLTLLASVMRDKDVNFRECDIISNSEKMKMRQFYTSSDYPSISIVEQFRQQCEKHRDKIALSYKDENYTYEALDSYSSKIANYIIKKTAGKKGNIAIMLERSAEMVVAILAVLKCGCAYVPIDLDFPETRKKFILEDSTPFLMITKEEFLGEVEICEKYDMILLDSEQEQIQKCSNEKTDIFFDIDDTAYIIYTSGSTGKPKGTLLSHRGVNNLVSWDFIGIKEESRVLQFASFCFDASVLASFCALLRGATLVVAPKEVTYDVEALINTLKEKRITFVLLSPSLISQIPEDTEFYLDTLVAGGEECPSYLAEVWGKKLNFINLYGPTEATVCVTGWSSKSSGEVPEKLPIGKPLPNAKIYIIDNYNQIVPIGVKGEICIEGPMLADGYLNNPDMTNKHFVRLPFSDSVIYKTGDIGRFLSDGNIEFEGRIDSQVKIRGFRIEIGEIESVLMKYSGIKEAVVIPTLVEEEKVLIAFVVPEKNISKKQIWKYLDDQLPSYMKPSIMNILPCLPKTVSGKIDRKLLQNMKIDEIENTSQELEVASDIQKQLIEIWQALLHRRISDIDSSFFENGGHSLKLLDLVSRINEYFHTSFSIKDVYECQTIKEQGSLIEKYNNQHSKKIENQKQETVYLDPGNVYELSFSQEQIWNSCNLTTNESLYNIVSCYEVCSDITVEELKDALDNVIKNHTVFRTRLIWIEDKVYQFLSRDSILVQLKKIDGEYELSDLVKTEFQYKFNLYQEPLARFFIIENQDKKYLLLNIHHIIFDGWSLQKLLHDVDYYLKNEVLELSSISFGNCVLWRNNMRQKVETAETEKIEIVDSKYDSIELQLPYDFQKPIERIYEGSVIQHEIGDLYSRQLSIIASELKVSEFSILLSVLALTLWIYTRQEDIVIGTTLSGRVRDEEKDVIGMFVNTLPIGVHIEENENIKNFICIVFQKLVRTISNQDKYSMVKNSLDGESEKQTNHGAFQVVCSQEEMETADQSVFKYMDFVQSCSSTAKFDLTFSIRKNSEHRYNISIEYSTELFTLKTIEGIYSNYKQILQKVLNNPSVPCSDVKKMDVRNALITDLTVWNKELPRLTIKELFEASEAKYPNRIALVYKEKSMTYEEVNQQANRVAHSLIQKGLQVEEPVLILAERSFELIIGIISVVKAGGMYVVIDASYPEERISYIMEHSQSGYLLCQKKMMEWENVISFKGSKIMLNDCYDKMKKYDNPVTRNNIENGLYIIYTSGSTGRPKGVVVTNRNVIRLMEVTKKYYRFSQDDVWTLFHSLSFDFSVWELYGAILYGARLVIVPKMVAQNAEAFLELLYENKVTVLNQTPSAFYQLMEQEIQRTQHKLHQHLRYIIFGGESLTTSKLEKWFSIYQEKITLINMYGITETTVHSTYRVIRPEDTYMHLIGSPIGRPLADLKFLLLDPLQNVVPQGAVGEIYITGDGVARCYFHDQEKTKEVFYNQLLGLQDGRWYRTGDLARCNSDGELEYIGRVDEQVKIRGFRIELKEIENIILQNEHIRNAVVLTDTDGNGETEIIAVAETDLKIIETDLRSYMRSYLPRYMMPANIYFVDKIPLTHNGKVDKKELKNRIHENITEEKEILSDTEEKIITIWKNILNRKFISKNDDFFDIGGHSLKILEMIHAIQKIFHLKLSFREIFLNSTVEKLAEEIEKELEKAECLYVYEIERDGAEITIYQSQADAQSEGIPEGAKNLRIIYER